jgi:hypothetical protein
MKDAIRNLVVRELNNNEVVTLHSLYRLVAVEIEDESKTQTQQRHRVRSILDGYRRGGKLSRIASQTYSKTIPTI